jgi:hypothetical protein
MNGFTVVAIIFSTVLACGAITIGIAVAAKWQDRRAYKAWLRNRPHCDLGACPNNYTELY